MAKALNQEYQYRFNHQKNHKSYDVNLNLENPPIIDLGLTKPPQALPDAFKQENAVKAYREYYKKCKRHLAYWTKRYTPTWYI